MVCFEDCIGEVIYKDTDYPKELDKYNVTLKEDYLKISYFYNDSLYTYEGPKNGEKYLLRCNKNGGTAEIIYSEKERLLKGIFCEEDEPGTWEIKLGEPKEKFSEKPFLPVKPGTKWEDIRISLIENDTIEIFVKDKSQKFRFNELNFKDKRKANKPKATWWVLVRLIKENGFVDRNSENFDPKFTDEIKRFKVHMKDLFGIKDVLMPHYKKNFNYKVNFKTQDKTHVSYETLLNNFNLY